MGFDDVTGEDYITIDLGDGTSRREVLKKLSAAGAAMGMAGVAGCQTDSGDGESTPTDDGGGGGGGNETVFNFDRHPAVAPPQWDSSNTESGAGDTQRTAVFVYQNSQNPFFVPMTVGFNDALNTFGWTGQATAPRAGIGGNAPEQANIISQQIDNNLEAGDLLVTTILDASTYNTAIQKALDNDIAVINGHTTPNPDQWNREFMLNEASGTTFDGGFSYRGEPMYIPHVGIKDENAGVAMAAEAYERMQEAFPEADTLKVLISNGLDVNPSVTRRVDKSASRRGTAQRYFETKSDPSVNIANSGNVLSTGPNPRAAETAIESAVDAQSLHGLVSAGFWGAVGAGSLRQDGQISDDAVIGGFDLERRMITSIQSGGATFTVAQDPYSQGFMNVPLAWIYLERGMEMKTLEWGVSIWDESNIGFADERRNWNALSSWQSDNYDDIGDDF